MHNKLGVSFLVFLLAVAAGCKSSSYSKPPAKPTAADQQLRDLSNSIIQVNNASPNLPGFQGFDTVAENAFRNRTEAEQDLLLGRLYYDSAQRDVP